MGIPDAANQAYLRRDIFDGEDWVNDGKHKWTIMGKKVAATLAKVLEDAAGNPVKPQEWLAGVDQMRKGLFENPKDKKEIALAQQLQHHDLLVFLNLSKLWFKRLDVVLESLSPEERQTIS